jgi:hypothetical protein
MDIGAEILKVQIPALPFIYWLNEPGLIIFLNVLNHDDSICLLVLLQRFI